MPSPVYAGLCVGILPVAAQLSGLVQLSDPITWLIGLNSVVGALVWFWIARAVCRRAGTRIMLWAILPAAIAMGAVPIHGFDCMDGAGYTRCSAYRLYSELVVHADRCGDW
jgi:hypothetical protein